MRHVRVLWFALLLALVSGPLAAVAMQELTTGVAPFAIRIPKAMVNTTIEPLQIADGSPENPAGTWTVGWYEQYGPLGDGETTILYGYPDFLGVGPAVFWFLPGLREGDAIEVTGDDGFIHPFVVSSVAMYERASAPLGEIFGDTGEEVMTLFSGAPPYDDQGNYLNLVVIRATPAGDPFAMLTSPGTADAETPCTLDPQALKIDGQTPAAVDTGPEARDLVDLASAVPADAQTIESIQTIVQAAASCPIAVREAMVLPDGRVITLVGPPGIVPLDELTTPGGFTSLSSAPEARAFAYILFSPNNGGWEAAGIPWYAGLS